MSKKRQKTTRQWFDISQPIVVRCDRKPGLRTQIAEGISEMTGERYSRQEVNGWLNSDPKKRIEPRYSIGFCLLAVASIV